MDNVSTVRDVLALLSLRFFRDSQIKKLLLHYDEPLSYDLLTSQYGKEFISKNELERAYDTADHQLAIHEHRGVTLFLINDPQYPRLLKMIANPPLILYCKGNLSLLNSMIPVTVVGSRKIIEPSAAVAHRLGQMFSVKPFALVSGLAVGIDTVAHQGALASQDGYTVAVLAHSLDYVYPKKNIALATEILKRGGCLISEHSIGTHLHRSHFVRRNRILSGVSYATIVVQAGIVSGSVHTMKFASDQNRILAAYDPVSNISEYAGNRAVVNSMNGICFEDLSSLEELQQTILRTDSTLDMRLTVSHQMTLDL